MHRLITLSIGIAVILGSCLVGGAARAQAPAQTVIRAIEVTGYQHVSQTVQDDVQKRIQSQVGQVFSAQTAEKDVEMLRQLGWFFRADYRTEPMADGVRLLFAVVENPIVTQIAFIGNTRLKNADLLKVIQTQPNQVLNRDVVAADAGRIKQAYAALGYTLVTVTNINITPDGKLEFTIFEPKISEVRIEGKTKTKDYVILRELTNLKPGDVYNEIEVRKSLQNLQNLNIFQEVTAVPESGTEPGTLVIVIRVVERRTGLASVGFGHSNIKGLIGFVDVSDTNVYGSGTSLSARAQFGAESSYQLSYSNPWIDDERTNMTLNLYNRTILRQAVQVNQTFIYNEKRNGGNITFGRPISADTRTRANITMRADKVSATPENDSAVPPELLEGSDVRSITLAATRDTRDIFLNPTKGTYTNLGTELAGFGGARFTKFTGELRGYWSKQADKKSAAKPGVAKTPLVFASRLMAGTITGAPPFLDQFLLGGADTLRGFQEDRFPGKNMLLLNTELRIPITGALQGVTFVDFGDTWGGKFAQGFGDPSFKLHTGYGIGIRVQTPIGPLRLDYGLNTEGGKEFHFGVGSTF